MLFCRYVLTYGQSTSTGRFIRSVIPVHCQYSLFNINLLFLKRITEIRRKKNVYLLNYCLRRTQKVIDKNYCPSAATRLLDYLFPIIGISLKLPFFCYSEIVLITYVLFTMHVGNCIFPNDVAVYKTDNIILCAVLRTLINIL